jgi:hypothetical protein
MTIMCQQRCVMVCVPCSHLHLQIGVEVGGAVKNVIAIAAGKHTVAWKGWKRVRSPFSIKKERERDRSLRGRSQQRHCRFATGQTLYRQQYLHADVCVSTRVHRLLSGSSALLYIPCHSRYCGRCRCRCCVYLRHRCCHRHVLGVRQHI